MAENEKDDNFRLDFWGNSQNHFQIMRKNVDKLMKERKMTIKQLTVSSSLNYETVKTFIYDKDAKDCKLSTAIGIAKAFKMTIAELAETGTIGSDELENMKIYRKLPDSSKSLIDWHIRNQNFLHEEHSRKREISVMKPLCAHNGNLKRNYDYDKLDTSDLDEEIFHKVFFGIKIPCNHYVPQFLKDDILLIANDRIAMENEYTVIVIDENIAITRRVEKNGSIKYYGFRDNILHADNIESVQVVGYIAKVVRK